MVNDMKEKIKQRLIEIAQKSGTITYGELEKDQDIFRLKLFRPLDEINVATFRENTVLLSAVVVTEKSRLPGNGFFLKAKERWHKNVDPDDENSCREFHEQECANVYQVYSTTN